MTIPVYLPGSASRAGSLGVALITFCCFGTAHAACSGSATGNSAFVTQASGASSAAATVTQSAATSADACIDQNGTNPTAVIVQLGVNTVRDPKAEISQSGGSDQAAYIKQSSNAAVTNLISASIFQTQTDGTPAAGSVPASRMQNNATLLAMLDASTYGAIVAQSGTTGLTATITQSGSGGGYAEIGQLGQNNTATITQSTTNASQLTFASVVQDGNGLPNTASIIQDGTKLSATLTQTGDGLDGSISQTGNDTLTATLSQTGSSLNAIAITQDFSGVGGAAKTLVYVAGTGTFEVPNSSVTVTQNTGAPTGGY